MQRIILTGTFIAMFVLSCLFYGCHNYYKPSTFESRNGRPIAGTLDSLAKTNRYLILRSGGESYHIQQAVVSADRKTMTMTLDTLLPEHRLHLVKGRKGKFQYKKSTESMVLNEVHLYVPVDNNLGQGSYTIDLGSIQKIELLEKDAARTTSSYVIGVLGYSALTAVVVTAIIIATKSSCPFVSGYDGEQLVLQGEIYGGAIYPQLERDDYLKLKLKPGPDNKLVVAISNELKEKQYTDFAELWMMEEKEGERIYADQEGNLFTVSDAQSPIKAVNRNKDISEFISKSGDEKILHLDDTTGNKGMNAIELSFENKYRNNYASLVLHLKNSYWLDFIYGEMAKGLGTYYATYNRNQKKRSAEELNEWTRKQNIPLEIFIRTNGEWKLAQRLITVGPLALREMVVPLEIADAGNITDIKIQSGFMFWEIDYVAIQFGKTQATNIRKLMPSQAVDEKGRNVLPQILHKDKKYLEQPDIGDIATIKYALPGNYDANKKYTYILHTRGYYEHIRDFRNKPDISFLNNFRNEGAMSEFSKYLFNRIRETSTLAVK